MSRDVSAFGQLSQWTPDSVTNQQQIFISHSPGGWESETLGSAWPGGGPLLSCTPVPAP